MAVMRFMNPPIRGAESFDRRRCQRVKACAGGPWSKLTLMDPDVLSRLVEALERHRVRYAVFGAVALGVHGLVRFTEDLDLFVAPEEANISALKHALTEVFADPAIEDISSTDLLGEYPAVQYGLPDGSFHIDIVTRLGEAFSFADLETEHVPFMGGHVSVVTPRTLFLMKRDTVRLKDRADAEALRQRFKLEPE
jgi:hypothetical protein